MTLYNIKPAFQNFLRPLTRLMYFQGITANQVTIIAMLASVILGMGLTLFPQTQLFILMPVFLFIRMALNAIDGILAREFNQKSQVGAILNEVGDIVADAALYLPFAFLKGINPWLVVLVVFLAWLTEFCGVVFQTLTGVRSYKGPMGKSDRALVLGAMGGVIAFWPNYIFIANIVFGMSCLLLIWTCINRCRNVREVVDV
ncbi:CDP-alcohol phosphatidyltransferase family protein [Escherichia coli]|nr:CDP-alcohol phosphatidyltransferase family protein [Escherichia coli]